MNHDSHLNYDLFPNGNSKKLNCQLPTNFKPQTCLNLFLLYRTQQNKFNPPTSNGKWGSHGNLWAGLLIAAVFPIKFDYKLIGLPCKVIIFDQIMPLCYLSVKLMTQGFSLFCICIFLSWAGGQEKCSRIIMLNR